MPIPNSSTPRHRIFLCTVSLLAAAPVLRIADIQLLELFFFLHISWLFLVLLFRKLRVPINRIWRTLGTSYFVFFFAALLLALASLRFHFYPPELANSFLKKPFIISLSRIVELSLGAFYMLYIATILSKSQADRLYAIQCYFWGGFASACLVLLSVPVKLSTGVELAFYGPLRARGLFNEGGPYGLYLITVIVAGILLRQIGGLSRLQTYISMAIIIPVFLLAQSKAAIFALFILILIRIFTGGNFRLKVSLIAFGIFFVIGIFRFSTLGDQAMGYLNAYRIVQNINVNVDQSVYGGFGGRLAGAILVPRMIMAHPVTGIGLGNYSILFNDPNYLQGLPSTEDWELPGIGLAGYIAELGIPLFVYLMFLLCIPAVVAYRKKSMPIVLTLAVLQPLIHVFGAQLNFYYPWICAGLALSFIPWDIQRRTLEPKTYAKLPGATPAYLG